MCRLVEPNSKCKQDDVQNEMEIRRINQEFKELQQSFKYIKSRNNLENEVIKEAGNCKKKKFGVLVPVFSKGWS